MIGFVTCIVAVQLAALYQDWLDAAHALILGAAIGIAAPLGDLFESQVKRDAGTKDAGNLFGVHGGALDRLDAAFFALVTGLLRVGGDVVTDDAPPRPERATSRTGR